MADVYVGLGSNVDPVHNLRAAEAGLRADFGELELSSVYRSAPVGFVGDHFLNMVVRFMSLAGVARINAQLSALEEMRGRLRSAPSPGPRTLDLDLLLVGQRVDPQQRLPHSDILLYPFVLQPLAELAPGLVHPVTGTQLGEIRSVRADQAAGLVCLGPLSELCA